MVRALVGRGYIRAAAFTRDDAKRGHANDERANDAERRRTTNAAAEPRPRESRSRGRGNDDDAGDHGNTNDGNADHGHAGPGNADHGDAERTNPPREQTIRSSRSTAARGPSHHL